MTTKSKGPENKWQARTVDSAEMFTASLVDTGTGADGLNRFNAASATAFPVVSRQIDTLTPKG